MLDAPLRKLIDPPLNRLATKLTAMPVTGNMITITGFGFGLLACIALALGHGLAAFALLVCNRLCDGMDGAVARARGENSDFGGYLDITLDFLIYAGVPFFAAVGLTSQSAFFAAAFVIYSMLCVGISFLAYAIIAAKRKMETSHQGKKSFYFSSGLMEGTETIIFMSLVCLLPQYFEYLCYGFGTLCWITIAMRIHTAWYMFR